jgi:hypothetical protein
MGVLEADGDRCVLTGSTRNPAMYAQEWLAPVPFDFTVEDGPELRDAVAVVAARFSAAGNPEATRQAAGSPEATRQAARNPEATPEAAPNPEATPEAAPNPEATRQAAQDPGVTRKT